MSRNELRARYEKKRTVELEMILKEDGDDYTPEALEVITEVLSRRSDRNTEVVCPYCGEIKPAGEALCECGIGSEEEYVDYLWEERNGMLILGALAFPLGLAIVIITCYFTVDKTEPSLFWSFVRWAGGTLLLGGACLLVRGIRSKPQEDSQHGAS